MSQADAEVQDETTFGAIWRIAVACMLNWDEFENCNACMRCGLAKPDEYCH